MKAFDLKSKLYLVMAALSLAIWLIWSIFYTRTVQSQNQQTEQYIDQISSRIMDTIEHTFLNLEYVAMSISLHDQVKDFLKETDPLTFHEKSQDVSTIFESVYRPDNLVKHVILINNKGEYYRLQGSLGNTALSRIGHLINKEKNFQHIAVTLEGNAYVGYITSIYDNQQLLGNLIFFMQGQQLQRLFQSYDTSNSLQIGLAAEQTIIAASDKMLIGEKTNVFGKNQAAFTVRQIGLTPFRLLISDNSQALKASQQNFAVASMTTFVLLLSLLFFFYRFLHKRFLSPTFQIIQNASQIGINSERKHLDPTGEAYFDHLVEQINTMVCRLEEHSQAIFDLDMKRQKAIILSLKKQINAHFVVNSLNVIRRLNETGRQPQIRDMCDGLSFLLRYVHDGEETIDGLDEIFVLEKYVDMMQIRYPDVFYATFQVEEAMDYVALPRMLIQPLLENAILHGLCPAGKKGHLLISIQVQDQIMAVCVRDDGVGMSDQCLMQVQESIEKAHQIPWDEMGLEHIALPNIQKRITTLYGMDYGLTIHSQPSQGTSVTLVFPVTATSG